MPMRVAILVVSASGLITSGITSSVINTKMVDQVNGQLEQGNQFPPAIWYYAKTKALHHDYRRLFPDGRLVFQQRVIIGLGAVCFLVAAWTLGFFGPLR
jgi:hypothetical protein